MTVSDFIFNFLKKIGVDTVFMVSGSSAMFLTDALYRTDGVQAICTHHEQAAVMAADLYGRTRRVPGAALVTIGPGATNAITGVAEAYLDSSPLVVISGQANSRLLEYEQQTGIRQEGTQSINLEPLVSHITKYFAAVMKPEDIRYHMERAYYESMHGRPGPVWLDVPVDIQNKPILDVMRGFVPADSLKNDLSNLSEVKLRLKAAQKPLILAGGGISRDVLNELLETVCVPVVVSRMGIGCISSNHECYVGRIGAYGQRAAHFALQQADFLLILGCRLSVSTTGYYPERFAESAYKVQIDIDPLELAKDSVPIHEKMLVSTFDFVECVKSWEKMDFPRWRCYCHELRKRYPVVQQSYKKIIPLNAYYFTEILTKLAPADAAVVVDTGSVCNIVSQTWHIKEGQSYLISGGLSCMGFWAGAMGCCQGGRSVLALSGDGSVSMNIQEFATLKYNNLPVKLFVFNNNGYMLIRHNQHNYMQDRFLGVGPDSGVQTPDFSKVAAAYGLPSVRIENVEELEEKIDQVLRIDGPVICEVILEQFGVMAPRIASKVMPDGSLKAAEFDDLAPFLRDDEKPDVFLG